MKRIGTFLTLLTLVFFSTCEGDKPEDTAPTKPNIIYLVADDLGYGEIGSYGQQIIQTPNMDALAANGMKFTQHYSGSPVCAPSRYVLLTGKHTGHAFIRGNDEWAERGEVWNYEKAVNDPGLEGQRPIPDSTQTLGELMQSGGYETAIVGKWGLGAPETEGVPNRQGFDYFYGYNCQRQAHNLYPVHLWENETKVLLQNELVAPGTKLTEGADPFKEASYAAYNQPDYAPQKMQQKALEFIKADRDKPFFLYYASPLPHVPLQVPQAYIDKYREIIGDEEPYLGERGYFPHRYPKAAYAGMINYLDDQLGELIQTLKDEGLYENTLIIFSSDNGPTYAGGVDPEYFNSAGPFPNQYGRTKGFTYEGGIRVPMIASWPGKIRPGTQSNHISAFYDVLPTLCEVGGMAPPEDTDGISFLPELLGTMKQPRHDYLYWEFPSYKGQQAVRMGDWKGLRTNMFEGNRSIELYNLKHDPFESDNLAAQQPEIVAQIDSIMALAHEEPALPNFDIFKSDK